MCSCFLELCLLKKYFEVKIASQKSNNECSQMRTPTLNDTLTKKVKTRLQAYKTNLKSLEAVCKTHTTSLSHNARKAVYISGASLYKERAAASEHIFLCRNRERKCAAASSYLCPLNKYFEGKTLK